ncbi:hypothetical protein MBLNU230_g5519t1 [Neophaeotheca triangularis]
MTSPGEKKNISLDVNEFIRTRDALSTAYMSLSTSIDRAVKAYIDHTNVVLAGDGSLNVSYLTEPFAALGGNIDPKLLAQSALAQSNGNDTVKKEDTDGKRKKRKYTPRDPNAPKRPLTAYFRYLQEQRGKLSEQMAKDPEGSHRAGDISKLATAQWKAMPLSERQPYRDAYQEATKEYHRKVAEYKAAGGVVPEETASPKEDDEDEEEEGAALTNVKPGEETSSSGESSESDDDDDEDEEEEKPAPSPPKQEKKTPKSKKSAVANAAAPAPPSTAKANSKSAAASMPPPSSEPPRKTSPDLKRKAPPATPETENKKKKKRGPKSKAEKEAEAAAAAAPPSSAIADSQPEPEAEAPSTSTKKAKKDRKKKSEA